MNTRSGKGYFYSKGQRDKHRYGSISFEEAIVRYGKIHALVKRNDWPEWAIFAYVSGYYGARS